MKERRNWKKAKERAKDDSVRTFYFVFSVSAYGVCDRRTVGCGGVARVFDRTIGAFARVR